MTEWVTPDDLAELKKPSTLPFLKALMTANDAKGRALSAGWSQEDSEAMFCAVLDGQTPSSAKEPAGLLVKFMFELTDFKPARIKGQGERNLAFAVAVENYKQGAPGASDAEAIRAVFDDPDSSYRALVHRDYSAQFRALNAGRKLIGLLRGGEAD